MPQGVQLQDLRDSSIWRTYASKTEEEQNPSSDLLRWLLFVPLILLLIFGCGSLALIQTKPASADTRSRMAADYQPWEFTVFKSLDPKIVLEILRDQELFPETFGEPVQPIVAPGSFWDPTETPLPGVPTPSPTALTQTPIATYTLTPAVLTSATSTLTVTASYTPTPTPFGPPSPIPPSIPPANTYWFYDDTRPLSHMMYTTLASGNERSSGSASFNSPSFNTGQVLQAGMTTVNFYAWNPAPATAVFTIELRSGGTLLGAGSFALPANTFDAYFFSASFSTSSHNFADGERLEVSFSLAAPAEMYWDGAFNYSGVSVPSVATAPSPTASSTTTVSPTPSSTTAPSSTPTNTPTNTPVPPTSMPTNTPIPPSSTPLPTATNTPLPTATPTASIAHDAVSSESGTLDVTGHFYVSLTTGSGADRFMLVGIDWRNATVASAVTYGPQSLTLVGTQDGPAQARIEIWRLVNPATGTATVTVHGNSADSGANLVVGVTTWTGVDQTTPLGPFASANGMSTTATVDVTSAAGELVHDTVSASIMSLAVSAGQTQRWKLSPQHTGGGSTEPGAATVTMSWMAEIPVDWAIGGVSIKPAN